MVLENELPCSERADAGKSMERIVAARGLWSKFGELVCLLEVTDLEALTLVGLKALVTITPEEREDPVTGAHRLTNRVPGGYASLAK